MLLRLRFRLKQLSDGRLVLRLPVVHRLAALGVGLYFLAILVGTSARGAFLSGNLLPLLFIALCLAAAAYHERWVFDRSRDMVASEKGVVLLHRSRRYRLSRMAQVRLSVAVRGRPGRSVPPGRSLLSRPIWTLALVDREGHRHRVETVGGAERGPVERTAGALARYCGLPLVLPQEGAGEERPP